MSSAALTLASHDRGEICLARSMWQPVIFAEEPQRSRLLGLRTAWPCRQFRLHVLRNQPFELVASVLKPFLAYAGWAAEVSYSQYDDALPDGADPAADVELVWIDFDRYSAMPAEELIGWLAERISVLRKQTEAPILVCDWACTKPRAEAVNRGLRVAVDAVPDVYVCDQSAIAASLGRRYRDSRAAVMSAVSMSDIAALHSARRLGLTWVPAVLEPRLKAIAVDLDGTLYAGILGEDGPLGLGFTAEHAQLHNQLVALRGQGLYLSLASRNEPEDVDALFATRTDLILRPDHFSAMAVSWAPKVEGIRAIAAQLRISVESILFVDDNPGELAAVATELIGIRCLLATDPTTTARALDYLPGLFSFTKNGADQVRINDLSSTAIRNELARGIVDTDEYLRSLRVELGFAMDNPANLNRLHELSQKTNQFNTGLLRLSEVEVARYIEDPLRRTVTIELRDRLSDSGIVGALFARHDGKRVVVDEIAISCRALGRRLEHLMITEAVRHVLIELPAAEVAFTFVPGPRNNPARDWLADAVEPPRGDGEPVVKRWDDQLATRLVESAPVAIRWESANAR